MNTRTVSEIEQEIRKEQCKLPASRTTAQRLMVYDRLAELRKELLQARIYETRKGKGETDERQEH